MVKLLEEAALICYDRPEELLLLCIFCAVLQNVQYNITNKSLDAIGVCQYIRWAMITGR